MACARFALWGLDRLSSTQGPLAGSHLLYSTVNPKLSLSGYHGPFDGGSRSGLTVHGFYVYSLLSGPSLKTGPAAHREPFALPIPTRIS